MLRANCFVELQRHERAKIAEIDSQPLQSRRAMGRSCSFTEGLDEWSKCSQPLGLSKLKGTSLFCIGPDVLRPSEMYLRNSSVISVTTSG